MPERPPTTSVRFEYWRKPGSDALASTAASQPVAVRRSRKRSCASTEATSSSRPDDAVLEMRHAVGLAEPGLFQLDSPRELVEQPTPPAEQDVDQVDSDLVHEPRGEELLVDVGAHEADPLVAGDLLGLRQRTLDAVGDEGE